MAKSVQLLSTVISLKPQGENNSSVCLITQEEGIIWATLYGGRKSRLKGLVSPWNTGTVWLSKDEKTKLYKISDFSVKKYHLTFRENLSKYYASSLAAEIALATKCTGNAIDFWALFNGFIDGLEACTEEDQIQAGLVRFLWRFLSLSGVQPDPTECTSCKKHFLTRKTQGDKVSYTGAEYSVTENSFICSDCKTPDKNTLFFLSDTAMSYLCAITELSSAEARTWPLTEKAVQEIKALVFFLVENAAGKSLKTLKTGNNLL